MKVFYRSGTLGQDKILTLSQNEIKALRRARGIAIKIREHAGEDDLQNAANRFAADVEGGIDDLLAYDEIVLESKSITLQEWLAS